MPIYAYKCAHCGHADDVLQKLADAPLTVCPKCGEASYSKQIT
ncbi:MAG: zinc ribbon domain-containing protein, partial [Betaproteobacteria bacterium]|nr:zinc ribbon domain-containing protein [Betaproteobacteria bacterium]